jgi:hypothetical protein
MTANVNNRAAEISFHITKGGNIFVKCATPKTMLPQATVQSICGVMLTLCIHLQDYTMSQLRGP